MTDRKPWREVTVWIPPEDLDSGWWVNTRTGEAVRGTYRPQPPEPSAEQRAEVIAEAQAITGGNAEGGDAGA